MIFELMEDVSLLTYKVVSFSEIKGINIDESIDRAIEMIELGYETPNLLMLASFSKPANYFEVISYLNRAILELGFNIKKGKNAILSYASYYVQKIVLEENIRENLTNLYSFCLKMDYEDLVYDFYRLYRAWDELDFSEKDEANFYWGGINDSNIEYIVVREAKKRVLKNKKYYLLV